MNVNGSMTVCLVVPTCRPRGSLRFALKRWHRRQCRHSANSSLSMTSVLSRRISAVARLVTSCGCQLVRRAKGEFNSDYCDCWLMRGWQISWCPEPRVEHRHGPGAQGYQAIRKVHGSGTIREDLSAQKMLLRRVWCNLKLGSGIARVAALGILADGERRRLRAQSPHGSVATIPPLLSRGVRPPGLSPC